MLDNLLPVFRPCLSVCVCIRMCEHSLHGQASELSAQRGVSGVLVDQLSEPWKARSSFIITLCWKITEREGSRLPPVVCAHTEHTFIQLTIPYLSLKPSLIHCLWAHFIESCSKSDLSVWLVGFQGKGLSCFLCLNLISGPQILNSVFKSIEQLNQNISDIHVSVWQISCDPVCLLSNHK